MEDTCLSLCLTIGASVSLFLMLVFNGLSGANAAPSIFEGSVSEASHKYETSINPSGWAFIIWTPIFLWLAVNMIIIITVFFLRQKNGQKLFFNPHIFSNSFLTILMVNFLLNTSWIFISDRSIRYTWLLGLSSAWLFLIAITNVTATAILARNIASSSNMFRRHEDLFAWGIVYRFILNGFAFYTTWTIIASLINLVQAWNYATTPCDSLDYSCFLDDRDRMKTSCLVSLSLLVVIHVTYFCVENLACDRICRYILTPYLVVIWGTSAIYDKKTGPGEPDDNIIGQSFEQVNNYVLAIIIIAVITFVVRTVLVAVRTYKNPI